MSKVVAIDSVGNVEFPDTMSDADIQHTIESEIIPQAQAAQGPQYGPKTLSTPGATPRSRGDVIDRLAARNGGVLPPSPTRPASPVPRRNSVESAASRATGLRAPTLAERLIPEPVSRFVSAARDSFRSALPYTIAARTGPAAPVALSYLLSRDEAPRMGTAVDEAGAAAGRGDYGLAARRGLQALPVVGAVSEALERRGEAGDVAGAAGDVAGGAAAEGVTRGGVVAGRELAPHIVPRLHAIPGASSILPTPEPDIPVPVTGTPKVNLQSPRTAQVQATLRPITEETPSLGARAAEYATRETLSKVPLIGTHLSDMVKGSIAKGGRTRVVGYEPIIPQARVPRRIATQFPFEPTNVPESGDAAAATGSETPAPGSMPLRNASDVTLPGGLPREVFTGEQPVSFLHRTEGKLSGNVVRHFGTANGHALIVKTPWGERMVMAHNATVPTTSTPVPKAGAAGAGVPRIAQNATTPSRDDDSFDPRRMSQQLIDGIVGGSADASELPGNKPAQTAPSPSSSPTLPLPEASSTTTGNSGIVYGGNDPIARAKWELAKKGITSEQEAGYRPGISEALHQGIRPEYYGYDNATVLKQAARSFLPNLLSDSDVDPIDPAGRAKPKSERDQPSEDGWRLYLGLPQLHGTYGVSDYTPTQARDRAPYYFKINNGLEQSVTTSDGTALTPEETASGLKQLVQRLAGSRNRRALASQLESENVFNRKPLAVLGDFTVSLGGDAKGPYISYYDKWDLTSPLIGQNADKVAGKPFEVYDRLYFDPKTFEPILSDGDANENQVPRMSFKQRNPG